MVLPLRRRIKNKERLWTFRAKLMRLYEEFEVKLERLCKEFNVENNCWYTPSKVPQPKFVFDRVGLSADTLYDEEEFSLLFSPKTTWEKNQQSTKKSRKRDRVPTRNDQIISRKFSRR